jgi:molecular chaperone HscB
MAVTQASAVIDKSITLASTDFALFDVTQRFAQDRAALDARWKDLQREAHPDKFAVQGTTAQRLAMQWSVRINEAYQRLKDPLKRAAYLCELGGAPVDAENNTAMPTQFLMQQMEWREQLDATTKAAEVEALSAEVLDSRRDVLKRCEELLDQQHDFAKAVGQVRALMFIERFCADIDTRLEHFETLTQ